MLRHRGTPSPPGAPGTVPLVLLVGSLLLDAGVVQWQAVPCNPSERNRGRDAGYPAPPAQIRTGPIKASGSHLGCVTAKRIFGQG